jgi:hypothetical protein
MNGSTNHELAKAMIKDRQAQARRAGERARAIEEVRATARDEQASPSPVRRGSGVARRVRLLLRSPAM